MLELLLLVAIVALIIAALPTWPYSGGWGYYPSAILAIVFVVVLVLLLAGVL